VDIRTRHGPSLSTGWTAEEWNEPVSANGRQWFERKMDEHTKVLAFRGDGPMVYVIKRKSMSDVRVWLCDVYTLGVADFEKIRRSMSSSC
jgi:hypothetical protein